MSSSKSIAIISSLVLLGFALARAQIGNFGSTNTANESRCFEHSDSIRMSPFLCGNYEAPRNGDTRQHIQMCRWLGAPKVRDIVIWEPASEWRRCTQNATECYFDMTISLSRKAVSQFGNEVDTKRLVDQANRMSLGSKGREVVASKAVRDGTYRCVAKSGYQAQVSMGVELRAIKGRMQIFRRLLSQNEEPKGEFDCIERNGNILAPIRGPGGTLRGEFECKQSMIANTSLVHFSADPDLMKPADREAATAALDKVSNMVPPVDKRLVESAQVNDSIAWASAQCFNIDEDELHYPPICSVCLQQARKRILKEARNRYGANLLLQDCQLRFQFNDMSEN